MSLFELGCSTWELIISRKIHNKIIVINKIIRFNYICKKALCEVFTDINLKGVLKTKTAKTP